MEHVQPQRDHTRKERVDIVRPARLQGFSDAVFATAGTLLVIPLRKFELVDGETLKEALMKRWPQMLVFLVGFLVICAVWESHIIRFKVVSKVDDIVVFFTLLSLMVTTFLPFTVELQGYYGKDEISVLLNCIMLICLEGIELIIFAYSFYNPKLLSERFTQLEPSVMKIKKRQIYLKVCINSGLFIFAAIFSFASFIVSWVLISAVIFTPLLRRLMVRLTYWYTDTANVSSSFEVLTGRISKERIEVFTDAAAAIVATLLILDLTTEDFPDDAAVNKYGLSAVLKSMWVNFVSYMGTFSTVGFLWFVHHSVLQHMKLFTPLMVLLNNLFLTFLAGTPFISTLVNNFTGKTSHNEQIAVRVSSLILLMASVMLVAILICAIRQQNNTMHRWATPENESGHTRSTHLYLLLKTLIIPVIALLVFLVSFSTDKATYYVYHISLFLVPVLFIVLKLIFACHCCQLHDENTSISISPHSSVSDLSEHVTPLSDVQLQNAEENTRTDWPLINA